MKLNNKSKNISPFRRAAALLTLLLYLLAELAFFPSQAMAQTGLQIKAGEGSSANNAPAAASQTQEIVIPPELGRIDEVHKGTSGKTMVYIQDAHDSLEAQENIAKLIRHLVENYGVKTVFEEGYEGPVPMDESFSIFKDPQAKEKVSYFLMDKLRLGGAEYAHVNRFGTDHSPQSVVHGEKNAYDGHPRDFQLIGVDSIELHKENIEWYKKSAQQKEFIEKDLEAIHSEIKVLANQHFPKELKDWMKLKGRLDSHQLNLLDYLKRVSSLRAKKSRLDKAADYPNIDLLLKAESVKGEKVIEEARNMDAKILFEEIDRFENNLADSYLANERDGKIYRIHKALNLLKRLNQIEVTPEELDLVKKALLKLNTKKIAQFLFEVSQKPIILSNLWERHIQNAIKFYETANKRDEVLGKSLESWAMSDEGNKKNLLEGQNIKLDHQNNSILVYGGFHKNRIKAILSKNNYSYFVVTPKISEIRQKHQDYYKTLMGVGHHAFELPAIIAKATRVLSTVEGAGWSPLAIHEVLSDLPEGWPSLDSALFANQLERKLELEAARSEARNSKSNVRFIQLREPPFHGKGHETISPEIHFSSGPSLKFHLALGEVEVVSADGDSNRYRGVNDFPDKFRSNFSVAISVIESNLSDARALLFLQQWRNLLPVHLRKDVVSIDLMDRSLYQRPDLNKLKSYSSIGMTIPIYKDLQRLTEIGRSENLERGALLFGRDGIITDAILNVHTLDAVKTPWYFQEIKEIVKIEAQKGLVYMGKFHTHPGSAHIERDYWASPSTGDTGIGGFYSTHPSQEKVSTWKPLELIGTIHTDDTFDIGAYHYSAYADKLPESVRANFQYFGDPQNNVLKDTMQNRKILIENGVVTVVPIKIVTQGDEILPRFANKDSRSETRSDQPSETWSVPEKLEEMQSFPRHLDLDQLEKDRRHFEEINRRGDGALTQEEISVVTNPSQVDWNNIYLPSISTMLSTYYIGAFKAKREAVSHPEGKFEIFFKQDKPELTSEDYRIHGLYNLYSWAAWKRAGVDPESAVGKELFAVFPTYKNPLIQSFGLGYLDGTKATRPEEVLTRLKNYLESSPKGYAAFLAIMRAMSDILTEEYRYRSNFNATMGGLGDHKELWLVLKNLTVPLSKLNHSDIAGGSEDIFRQIKRGEFIYTELSSTFPLLLRARAQWRHAPSTRIPRDDAQWYSHEIRTVFSAVAAQQESISLSEFDPQSAWLNWRKSFLSQSDKPLPDNRSEVRSQEKVAARIKQMSGSGIEDWDELLMLMESYPQYFDRIYLDIDETIFTSKVYLGSHQWHVDEARYFESGRWRLSAKKGRIEKELLKKGLLRLVEPRLTEVLREMKRRNPKLIVQGVTSRRGFMAETTKQILNSLGLGDLEVTYDSYKGRKLEVIHRDLAADEKPERGITLFIDDEVEGFAKHNLMKTIDQMGAVVLTNKKVSSFDLKTSLSLFRKGLAEGAAAEGVPQPEDHLTDVLLLSRFSDDAAARAAVYLDPDIRQFVAAGSDKVKMAYIEAVTDFFSRSFENHLPESKRDELLDIYYGLVSFDKELWQQAHREGKLTYQIIDRSRPYLHGRGNYEILLTPENAYFFMEPVLDYLVAEKPDVILLPDTAARPFTKALRHFIEREGLPTRVINFPISTGDARDTRYELTRWMRLLHGQIPVSDQADEKLVAYLREAGIDRIHSGNKVIIFDDGITRGHAVNTITNVVEDTFGASVQGAFTAFDYRRNIGKRRFSAFSSFRVYGEFGSKDSHYSSAPSVIVRLAWEFDSGFKGVSSRRPYHPPPPKHRDTDGGGTQVLEAFKVNHERFFHRSQRNHRLPERPGDSHRMRHQPQKVNAVDTTYLPDEIRGFTRDVLGPTGLTRKQLIEKLERLSADAQGGAVVRLLRTQVGLATAALGSDTAVSLIEREKRKLTEESLNRILRGLMDAYKQDGRLSVEEVEFYVRKGFGGDWLERVGLPDQPPESAANKAPRGEKDGLSLIRVRDELPPWAFEDKTITTRVRRLLGEKNVFFYRLVRGNEDLGFVILAVLKNRAGEDSLVIEKIQPRIIHDQDVQPEAVRDLIVRYLSEDNKTIQALYTDTKIAYMAGVSESHRIRRVLSNGYFKLMPQTRDLWHEGTEDYYSDHLAGDIGLIWQRFDPDDQQRFESASKNLEIISTATTWGSGLIKKAFETDIRRYTAYQRMHLPFNQGDLLVLQEIVQLLKALQGQLSNYIFKDSQAEEEAKFSLRAQVELLKYRNLDIKPDFKQFYTSGGTEQRKAKLELTVRFFLGNFWNAGYDLAGMNWRDIQKSFADWGAEDLLDKISGGNKGRFLERLMPGAYSRSGRYFGLREGYRPSAVDFQRYLDGEWYAVPAGNEYVIQGDENIPPHWDVAKDFFRSRKGYKVQFAIIDDVGLVGHEIPMSHIAKGVFFFRDGKTHYEARQPGVIQGKESIIALGSIDQQGLQIIDLKMRILQNARELMGADVVADIIGLVNDAISRHPLISSDPQQVLSDFEVFVDKAAGFSKINDIRQYFASLTTKEDGSFRRSEVRATKVDEDRPLVINRESVQNLRKKYVVPVERDVFEALAPEQQAEFYKAIEMYSENKSVNFVFIADLSGDRQVTSAWSIVNKLAEKYDNVRVKNLTSTNIGMPVLDPSEIQGRKVLGVSKEGKKALQAERLKKEVKDSKEFFLLKYLSHSKEAGLLLAAIKLLDSGQEDLLRLKGFFTDKDIPGSLLSQLQAVLMTYEAFTSSA